MAFVLFCSICFPAIRRTADSALPVHQPAREAAHHVGAYSAGDGGVSLAKAAARGANRVYGVDAGWSPEARELCRTAGRQNPLQIVRE